MESTVDDVEMEDEGVIESGFEFKVEQVVYQGAEAKITQSLWLGKSCMIKERHAKGYRHPTLDGRLNKARTKQEIRGMFKARQLGVETPAVYFIDPEKNLFVMERINGPTAKQWISEQQKALEDAEYNNLMELLGINIGEKLAILHRGGLIHGDLTTSNIILKNGSIDHPAFIDFGLSSQGKVTAEEKGVDLYVLERAIESTHEKSISLLKSLMTGYKKVDQKQFDAVDKKIIEIRLRGRKRDMIG